MPTVWLIRHAESLANAGRPTDDPATIGLTAQGQAQAEAIAVGFPTTPGLIVTSPYARTAATAAPLRRRFPAVPHAEWPVHEFTYLAPARCVGTTLDQRRPMAATYWDRGDPAYCDGAGAESFATLWDRTHAFLAQIAQVTADPLVVFTHGQFMSAILWTLLAAPREPSAATMAQFRAFIEGLLLRNGAVVQLQIVDGAVAWITPVRHLDR